MGNSNLPRAHSFEAHGTIQNVLLRECFSGGPGSFAAGRVCGRERPGPRIRLGLFPFCSILPLKMSHYPNHDADTFVINLYAVAQEGTKITGAQSLPWVPHGINLYVVGQEGTKITGAQSLPWIPQS